MQKPVVSGGAVLSRVLLVGQAPGDKEPVLGRPFAWTAGKKLFRWFAEHAGVDEAAFRSRVYMAAVCRCFPGKRATGGDRVPDPSEIENCSGWLAAEMEILRPALVIAVGKLAIAQFIPCAKLDAIIGQAFTAEYAGHRFDLVPLPHPSGASPWPHQEPGRTLLPRAMKLIADHPAWREVSQRRT
jgi:uracil-DNA glycosylase